VHHSAISLRRRWRCSCFGYGPVVALSDQGGRTMGVKRFVPGLLALAPSKQHDEHRRSEQISISTWINGRGLGELSWETISQKLGRHKAAGRSVHPPAPPCPILSSRRFGAVGRATQLRTGDRRSTGIRQSAEVELRLEKGQRQRIPGGSPTLAHGRENPLAWIYRITVFNVPS
jgi:hypothetical protein